MHALFPLLAVAASFAVELEFPRKALEVSPYCNPRTFLPDGSTIAYWCGDNLTLVDTATGRATRSFDLGRHFARTHIAVTPDGSRIAVVGAGKDGRKWDLVVVDASSGEIVFAEDKVAKLEVKDDAGLAKLLKKVRKADDILKDAAACGIMHVGIMQPYQPKTFEAPNGLTVTWEVQQGGTFDRPYCLLRVARNGKVLRASKLEWKAPPGPGYDLTADLQLEQQMSRSHGACEEVVASEDGKRLVFRQMSYRLEVKTEELDLVARRKRAEHMLAMGYLSGGAGRHAEAVKEFTEALELDPSLIRAQLLRGLSHLKLENAQGASADLEKAAKLLPDADKKDLAEAKARAQGLASLQAALQRNANDTAALRQRALFRVTNEWWRGCAEDLKRAQELGANLTPEERKILGQCAATVRRISEAAARADQAKADAELAKTPIRIEGAGAWVTNFDLSGVSRAIIAGQAASGSGGSPGSSAGPSSARPYTSSYSGGSGRAGSASAGTDYNAIVNQRIEKKLWDMNNPANRR